MTHFTPASDPSVIAFLAIVFSVLIMVTAAIYYAYAIEPGVIRPVRKTTKVAGCLLIWLAFISLVVGDGRLLAEPMPGIPLFFAFVIISVLAFSFSPIGTRLATSVPLVALLGFQGFRLPLELVLHAWAEQGVIPVTMTWAGQNFDILSGFVAIGVACFAGRSRALLWIANFLGFALLINVGRVAMMSSPVPFGWGTQPPLQLALYLPYAWIAPVCVGGALAGHLILTRALFTSRA